MPSPPVNDPASIERYKLLCRLWSQARIDWHNRFINGFWRLEPFRWWMPPPASLNPNTSFTEPIKAEYVTFHLEGWVDPKGKFVRVSCEGWWIEDYKLNWTIDYRRYGHEEKQEA